jgi:hypothetical protein
MKERQIQLNGGSRLLASFSPGQKAKAKHLDPTPAIAYSSYSTTINSGYQNIKSQYMVTQINLTYSLYHPSNIMASRKRKSHE